MGLTYKALKYRDINKNVTTAKAGGMAVVDADAETIAQQQAATLSITASTAQVNATTTIIPENQQQQQFTADHIMKLCLFLAEKSRAKQLQQSQQMDARRFYENFLQEATESVEDEQMLCDSDAETFHNHMANFENKLKSPKNKTHITPPHQQTSPRAIRRTKMKSEKHIKPSVLTDKFSISSSSNLLSYNTLPDVCEKTHDDTQNYQQPQQHQHQQDKRDILLKIRQQIFERKRLRQVLSGGQRQHAQYPLGTQQQQQQQQLKSDYNNAQLQQQVELQRLADVWRPW